MSQQNSYSQISPHTRTGCSRELFLQLYRSLIRSQLDYGSPIYSQTCKSALNLLKTIQASSLRLSLGAFRTSPHLSRCAEAAELPLTYRTLILTSNFLAFTAQFPELPIYNSVLSSLIPFHFIHRSHLTFFTHTKWNPGFLSNHILPNGYSLLRLSDSI